MNGFINAAKRPVESITNFLRDAADNTIKYKPESGKKHWVYIPYREVQNADGTTSKEVIAIQGRVHENVPEPNKYDSCICMSGVEMTDKDGNVVNDGTCPYCDRVGNSYDIYRYKMEQAKIKAEAKGFQGAELEEFMKNQSRKFMQETPVGKAKPYMYLLIIQFKLNASGQPEIGADGLPVFEPKVMKLSDKGITKIQETFTNSGLSIEGSEAIFKYQVQDTPMLVAGSRTVSPVFNGQLLIKYPGLAEAIDATVKKWDWEGLDSAFKEWKGKSTAAAKADCDRIFRAWDAYVADPSVGFLTDTNTKVNNPALTDGQAQANVNEPVATNTPVGGATPTPQMGFGGFGNTGVVDPNAAFGGMPRM